MILKTIRELGDVQSGDGNDLRLRASQQKTVTAFPAGTGALPKVDEEVEYEDDDEEYDEEDYTAAEDTKSAKLESAKKHDEKLAVLVKDKENKIETPKNININKSADSKIFSQHSPTQKQSSAIADPSQKYSLVQTQNGKSVYQPSETTEKIPEGFSGRILTEKKVEKSAEKPAEPPKKIITRFLPSKHLENRNSDAAVPKNPDSYVTLTKSVSGSLDDKAPTGDGKFASTYYTKTSTCGYFTFSCNIVYGQNGRSKICRPKTPGNGKC